MKTYKQHINERKTFYPKYSTWKKYQLFLYKNVSYNGTITEFCYITQNFQTQIKKIFEYNQSSDKIVIPKKLYFIPNDDNDVIYKSNDLLDIYNKFEEVIEEIKMRADAKKYNI